MLPNTQAKTKVGDCEASHFDGAGVNCRITLTSRQMWLCDECLEKDRTLYERERAANKVIQNFRAIDETIQVKTDVFNAATPAIVEMQVAIEQDNSIPADAKAYACTKECERHYLHLKDVVVKNLRNELNKAENEMRMWQTNGQAFAGKLRDDIRKEFQLFDVSYTPTVVKSTKPKVVKIQAPKESARTQIASAKAAVEKYGLAKINITYDLVMMLAKTKNITIEAAAKHFADDLL